MRAFRYQAGYFGWWVVFVGFGNFMWKTSFDRATFCYKRNQWVWCVPVKILQEWWMGDCNGRWFVSLLSLGLAIVFYVAFQRNLGVTYWKSVCETSRRLLLIERWFCKRSLTWFDRMSIDIIRLRWRIC